MWLIDITAGLNSVLLFEALFSIQEKSSLFLQKALKECGVPYLEEVSTLFSEKVTRKPFDISVFHTSMEKLPSLSFRDAVSYTSRFSPVFKKILEYSDEDTIDAFHHFLYLSIIILLEYAKQKMKVSTTIPAIGTGSPSSTLKLMKGRRVILDAQAEAVPPILAAILCHYFIPFIEVSEMRILEVRDIRMNGEKKGIRLIRGDERFGQGNGYKTGMICVLETNIDDSTSEIIAEAMNEVLTAGALDYIVIPATMKKGRMGFHIQVLTNPSDVEKIADLLLKSTSTFGIRFFFTERITMNRDIREVETSYGKIRVKQGYKGETCIKQMPEFDDLVQISRKNHIPIHILYSQIMREIKKKD
jgi:hypothetical protein